MAAPVHLKLFALVPLFMLTTFYVSEVSSSALLWDIQRLSRAKRELCQDGTYDIEGKTCCLCHIGQLLKAPCTDRPDDGQCEPCPDGQYNSHPSSERFCEPCTSCSHLNANLEEAESCTPARDAVCRCKPQHFSSVVNPKICYPCKKCSEEGIKEACTPTNDTVCNVKGGESSVGMYVGIAVAVAVFIVGVVCIAVYVWRRRQSPGTSRQSPDERNAPTLEMLLPRDVKMTRHIPEIVQVLGWPDMKKIALSSGMEPAEIDSCQESHPYNVEEQTIDLLTKWESKIGRNAARKLVTMLQKDNKLKAQKITDILNRSSTP